MMPERNTEHQDPVPERLISVNLGLNFVVFLYLTFPSIA